MLKLLDNFKTLGGHWIPHHNRKSERAFFGVHFLIDILKIIDGDIQQIHDIMIKRPNAILVLRDHPMSEQKSDMEKSPVATGIRHAREWRRNIDNARALAEQRGLFFPPDDQIVVLGINEPAVWSMLAQTVMYYVAFLDELKELGLCGGALNLSVGWPANTGTDTPPDWSPYLPVYKAIIRGGHILVLHEYWSHLGPHEMWRWWAGRYTQCPWDVPILIAEAGVDEYVADGTVDSSKRGWGAWMDAAQYTEQLTWYSQRLIEDNRIIGFTPFTSDYASDDWVSFDMELTYPHLHPENFTADRPMYTKGDKLPPVIVPIISHIKFKYPYDNYDTNDYWLTQSFGDNPENYRPYKGHTGIDWAMPVGTEVLASEHGTVIEAGEYGDWGNYVKIDHEWGHTVYAHLSEIFVGEGEEVWQGHVIGKSGNTGRSTGPHLHFGVRFYPHDRSDEWNGYSDPMPHLVAWEGDDRGENPTTKQVVLHHGDTLELFIEGRFDMIVKEITPD